MTPIPYMCEELVPIDSSRVRGIGTENSFPAFSKKETICCFRKQILSLRGCPHFEKPDTLVHRDEPN